MADEITVLVVDEDEDVLDLTETFLERESDAITVRTEQRVSAALEHVESGDVDCVVSDYRMPGTSGLEFFEQARAIDDSLPFFLFSARTDEAVVEKAEAAGVTNFVEKGAGADHYRDLAAQIEDAVR